MKVLLDNGHGENTPGKRSPKWSDGSQLFEWEYAREIAKGIESQSGRVNVKTAALNILKGFFACALVSVVPIELYKFCVTLQNTFAGDLTRIFAGSQAASFGEFVAFVLRTAFLLPDTATAGLKLLCFLIAFAYCTIKVFFANIKQIGRASCRERVFVPV